MADHTKHDSFPMKIRYLYETDTSAPTVYAHGVWGGVNPHGEIEMQFYTESDKLPESTECVIHADGAMGPEMSTEDEDTRNVLRTIGSKVLVNYHTARALIDWLEEKVSALEMEDEGILMGPENSNGPAQ